MRPKTKKVVTMAAISIGIVTFAFLLPTVIIPVTLSMMQASSCTDYDCAQSIFSKCGAYQSSGESNLLDSMAKGMHGLMCMMGLDDGRTRVSVSASPITLNKV
jgi:hypothetical protein